MKVTTGTVVNGKIVSEGVPLVEGEVVAVLSHGAGEEFTLAEAQEEDLLAAMAEIDRGEFETLDEVMSSLTENDETVRVHRNEGAVEDIVPVKAAMPAWKEPPQTRLSLGDLSLSDEVLADR